MGFQSCRYVGDTKRIGPVQKPLLKEIKAAACYDKIDIFLSSCF
jgi:hypothetical protein